MLPLKENPARPSTSEKPGPIGPAFAPAGEPRSPETTYSPFALLFVLEEMAVSRRRAAFDVLKREFGEKRKSFDEVAFIRALSAGEPEGCIRAALSVLNQGKEPDETVVQQVQDKIVQRLIDTGEPLTPGFSKLLLAAQRRKMDCLALTELPGPGAEALAGRLGLPGLNVMLLPLDRATTDLSALETWVRAAKHLTRRPRRCGVLAASRAVHRAALAAGMRCAAVPDEFNAHEDFSGASLVLEDWNERSSEEVLDVLFPERTF